MKEGTQPHWRWYQCLSLHMLKKEICSLKWKFISTLKTAHVCVSLASGHLQLSKLMSWIDPTTRWKHSMWQTAFIKRKQWWIKQHKHDALPIYPEPYFSQGNTFSHISAWQCLHLCTHWLFSSSLFIVRSDHHHYLCLTSWTIKHRVLLLCISNRFI